MDRYLTDCPDSEDTEPCYLPNGRIAFTSSRANRFVQCGDWALALAIYTMAPDGSDVRKVVQPVLDKHCRTCHDGSSAEGKAFDLRGDTMVDAPVWQDKDAGPQHKVSRSFLNLLRYVDYVKLGGDNLANLPLEAYATGSYKSTLMHLLREGHQDVELTMAEYRALAAWIDCNAPYYGGWDDHPFHAGGS